MAELTQTGTPGIYRAHRAKGTVYVARWREVDPDTGASRVRSKTLPTMAAAKDWLHETKHAQKVGTYRTPEVTRTTFQEVADQWLAIAKTRMRQRSWDNYERGLRLRLSPAFGKRRIDTISSRDVEKWLAGLGELTPGQARHLMAPLVAVMNYAHRHELIARNPCNAVERPTKMPAGQVKRTGTFLTRAQVVAIADHVSRDEPIYGLLVRFAAGTGLRRSEITGLRIGDMELDRKPKPNKGTRDVWVRRMVERETKDSWRTQDPKSVRSARRVPILDNELLDDMRAYLARHPRRFDPTAPVWPAKFRTLPVDFGAPGRDVYWNGNSFYKHAFLPAVAAAGLPATPGTAVRFHDLRHTCGSQWLQDGISLTKVSRRLGHHSVAFTADVYIHLADEPDYDDDVEKINRAIAAQGATAD